MATYYSDNPTLSLATKIYTNAALTALAPDGYYSDQTISRRQITVNNITTLEAPLACANCISNVVTISYSYGGTFPTTYYGYGTDALACSDGPASPLTRTLYYSGVLGNGTTLYENPDLTSPFVLTASGFVWANGYSFNLGAPNITNYAPCGSSPYPFFNVHYWAVLDGTAWTVYAQTNMGQATIDEPITIEGKLLVTLQGGGPGTADFTLTIPANQGAANSGIVTNNGDPNDSNYAFNTITFTPSNLSYVIGTPGSTQYAIKYINQAI